MHGPRDYCSPDPDVLTVGWFTLLKYADDRMRRGVWLKGVGWGDEWVLGTCQAELPLYVNLLAGRHVAADVAVACGDVHY